MAAALAATALLSCARAPLPPNVLVIVMDTTRADHCSLLGYPRPTTPCLEEFAKDAVTFSDAWSPAGWTGPAHASLFTGLRPEHHGFHDGDRYFLAEGPQSLAERFEAAGFATAAFTNNNWISPEWGLTRGFATVEPVYKRPGAAPGAAAAMTHALALEWASATSAAGRPFFLFVNDMEPHMPYAPPDADARRFLRGSPSEADVAAARRYEFPRPVAYALGTETLEPRTLALLTDLYDAEIASLDREIGVFLAALRTKGLLENTIVVVTSDHGELLGEHHLIEHAHSLHAAARRVPLVVRAPGKLTGGRRVTQTVRLEDVAPTLLELAGLPVPGGLDGAPLTRDLEHRTSVAVQGRNPNAFRHLTEAVPGVDVSRLMAGIHAAYDGRHHYLRWSDGRPDELYDLETDPAETVNLAATEVETARRLASLLPAFE